MVPLVPDVHVAAPPGGSTGGGGDAVQKLSSTALREREAQAGAGQ